ncbi:MAG: VWA domain-containing protein [Phycisphaera sp.]|nr:VWA domain-containing protein [Phycisphaera sp.]
MSFLFPLYLLAGLAVVGPIVLHLIRRHTKESRPFSSLMFLTPSPPRIQRRSRLENVLLLILRCTVLVLLALAFARPFLQSITEVEGGDSGRRIVLMIDVSASMQRDGLWEQATKKAAAALDDIKPIDRVAVFAFDRQPQPLLGFELWEQTDPSQRVALAREVVAKLKPGWAATDLGKALVTAAESIEDDEAGDDGKANAALGGDRRVVLISDVQDGAALDALHTYEWPKHIELRVDAVTTDKPTNAGLQLVLDADGVPTERDLAQPRVRVSSAADAGSEQFRVYWAEHPPTADGVGATPVYVPPGHSRVVRAPPTPAGMTGQRLIVDGDAQSFDNTLYLAPLTPQRINIVYVGDDKPDDSGGTLFYVNRALSNTALQTPHIVARAPGEDLSGFDAAAVQLMIVNGPLGDANLEAVRRYVATGRTALLLLRDTATAATAAKLLGVDSLGVTESAPGSRGGYAMLSQLDFTHPLLAAFDDPRFRDFTKIHTWRYRRISPDTLPKSAHVIARFDDPDATQSSRLGDAAWIEAPVGDDGKASTDEENAHTGGRLLIMTAGWRPDDSQLALSTKFVPLLYSILERSGGLRSQRLQYFVGDPVPIDSPEASATLKIRKPDGVFVTLDPTTATRTPDDRFVFYQADQPGVYEVSGPRRPYRFAVNIAPAEMRTAPLASEKLEQSGVLLAGSQKPKDDAEAKEHERQLRRNEQENRQKVWRWTLLAALCFVMAETWLAGRLSRPVAGTTGTNDSTNGADTSGDQHAAATGDAPGEGPTT